MYGPSYISVVSLIRGFVFASAEGSRLIKNQWQPDLRNKGIGPIVADLHTH